MERAGKFKVRILRDIDAPIGRGFIAFKEGYTGRVVPDVYDFLMGEDAAEDISGETSDQVEASEETADADAAEVEDVEPAENVSG